MSSSGTTEARCRYGYMVKQFRVIRRTKEFVVLRFRPTPLLGVLDCGPLREFLEDLLSKGKIKAGFGLHVYDEANRVWSVQWYASGNQVRIAMISPVQAVAGQPWPDADR